MYASYFGLAEVPFSITPDPRYLFMSSRHREAMAHLVYGLKQRGGFVQLTGEVGTGKTTLCRYLLSQLPVNIEVALVLNPTLNQDELLATVCDELHIQYPSGASSKQLLDRINGMLLKNYAAGKRTVLIVDEAQILRKEVLEQVRLLTNLETSKHKLLQIILIGQPELIDILERPELRQLAQRITARYHLEPLSAADTAAYVRYRLSVAGRRQPLFTDSALREVYRKSKGVPRLINVICDRALLGAYARNKKFVRAQNVRHAAKEVLGVRRTGVARPWWVPVLGALGVVAAIIWWRAASVDEGPPVAAVDSSAADETMAAAATGAPVPTADAPTADAPTAGAPAAEDPANDLALYPSVSAVATETRAPAPPPVSQLLRDYGDSADSKQAFARLVSLWQSATESVEQVDSCPEVAKLGLECLAKRGDWKDLRSHNRAAILPLAHGAAREAYVLLVKLTDADATIEVAGRRYVYPFAEIESLWTGDYLLLWQPPPLTQNMLAERTQGADVLWLRWALNRVADQNPQLERVDISGLEFDAQLGTVVREFQRRNALAADGIVGVETLIRLNTVLNGERLPLLVSPQTG